MIWSIFIGFIIGVIAKLLMPGKGPGGFIITILIGIIGSIFARWIGTQMGVYGPGDTVGFIASVFGAMGVLAIYRVIKSS